MFEQSAAFNDETGLVQAEDGFSQTHIPICSNNHNFSMEETSYPQNNPIISQQEVAVSTMEMELQHQLNLEMEQCYNNNNNDIGNGVQQIVNDSSNWQEMSGFNNGENHYLPQLQNPADYIQNGHHFTTSAETPYPDLLNMFSLPKSSSLLPNSSITFSNSAHKSSNSFFASLGLLGDLNPTAPDGSSASGSVVYDPLLPLNLPPQPPLLRELFHSLPHGGYNLSRNGSLFSGVDHDRDGVGGLYQNGDGGAFDNGVFEFTAAEMDCIGKNGKDTKHFASTGTERHRRVLLNDKYQALRKLIPSPTKNDRASIVGDAIDYINELKRSVAELKLLVEKKRCKRERLKRPKTENDGSVEGIESNSLLGDHMDHPCNGSSLRSSWLQRKSKNTEVDVRIVDDEVTVKLVQQKRINCLLFVSKVLDELQLDLHHVAGGLIGDYYSFLFNSKICEGSIVYASAVANKLIEVVDKQYAAIPPTTSY